MGRRGGVLLENTMMGADSFPEHSVLFAAKCLLEHGHSVVPFMPWHQSDDKYRWLIAEVLLRRTTRTAVTRVFQEFVSAYPTWDDLGSATPPDIAVLDLSFPIPTSQLQNERAISQHRLYENSYSRQGTS